MTHNPLIYIVYDGIANPVFAGQVVEPLLKRLAETPDRHGIIISFELNQPSPILIQKLIPADAPIKLVGIPRSRYRTSLSLRIPIKQLRTYLAHYKSYELIARGPIAGYIGLHGLSEQCTNFTIQARGLLAEEYRYAHSQLRGFRNIAHRLRAWQFEQLERIIYCRTYINQHFSRAQIEAVSPALRDYLISEFQADTQHITIAQHDLPKHIQPALRTQWRREIRQVLQITDDAKVFCYNGSLKPWQCPSLTLEFFKNELELNPHAILVVLTPDVKEFEHLVQKYNFSSRAFRILKVQHHEIYRYLSACDVGIMFREPHMMNWISRPTKALEYQAVGLKIIHNHTVAWLTQENKNQDL